MMTEQDLKSICKILVENGQKSLTTAEKELIKQAVDASKNWNELITTALIYAKS